MRRIEFVVRVPYTGKGTGTGIATRLPVAGIGVATATVWLRAASMIGPAFVGSMVSGSGLGRTFLVFGVIALVAGFDRLPLRGGDSVIAIDALRTLARNTMSRVPNPLSDTLLRWSPQGWKVVD